MFEGWLASSTGYKSVGYWSHAVQIAMLVVVFGRGMVKVSG